MTLVKSEAIVSDVVTVLDKGHALMREVLVPGSDPDEVVTASAMLMAGIADAVKGKLNVLLFDGLDRVLKGAHYADRAKELAAQIHELAIGNAFIKIGLGNIVNNPSVVQSHPELTVEFLMAAMRLSVMGELNADHLLPFLRATRGAFDYNVTAYLIEALQRRAPYLRA